MIVDDNVLSGDDVASEASLLVRHDLTSLRAQLERSLRRRRAMVWVLPIVTSAALIAASSLLPHDRPPAPMRVVPLQADVSGERSARRDSAARANGVAVSQVTSTEQRAPAPAPRPRLARAAQASSARPATPAAATAATASRAPTPTPDDAPAPAPASSRLRAELRAFDEATQALQTGRAEDALRVLRQLRAEHPDGPVDVDATVMIVRCLVDLGRAEEARAALADAAAHPHAREQRAAIARLTATLHPQVSDADDDEAPVRR